MNISGIGPSFGGFTYNPGKFNIESQNVRVGGNLQDAAAGSKERSADLGEHVKPENTYKAEGSVKIKNAGANVNVVAQASTGIKAQAAESYSTFAAQSHVNPAAIRGTENFDF